MTTKSLLPMKAFVALFALLMAAPHVTASRVLLQAGNCAPLYGQCGGIGFSGPTCCAVGSECKVQILNGAPNPYYSQCLPPHASPLPPVPSPPPPSPVPSSPSPPPPGPPCGNVLYDQCGGVKFTGLTCCPPRSSCVKSDEYYSQCRP
eukprot:TRINITY_DN1016_c0_g1_i1.p1 TRINITY_DN1016_c0_g1~~TRINITY_DN1016_c0_g1_i1.p1  ORF type:complete len:148 (-),score=4.10 TRINITY_DN1016_c0_g1_i1:386-829(-)